MILIIIMFIIAFIAALGIVIIDNYFSKDSDHYLDIKFILAIIGGTSLFWATLGFFII